MSGQTLNEWLGHGWLGAIHPDDRAYAERQWREAIEARGFINAEFRLRAPPVGADQFVVVFSTASTY